MPRKWAMKPWRYCNAWLAPVANSCFQVYMCVCTTYNVQVFIKECKNLLQPVSTYAGWPLVWQWRHQYQTLFRLPSLRCATCCWPPLKSLSPQETISGQSVFVDFQPVATSALERQWMYLFYNIHFFYILALASTAVQGNVAWRHAERGAVAHSAHPFPSFQVSKRTLLSLIGFFSCFCQHFSKIFTNGFSAM